MIHRPVSISVVIVNYNAAAVLTECVRSVLASSVPVHVYVSDNGSEDDSIQYLRSSLGNHPLLTIIENHDNLGFAKGNNVVVPQCRGDYILFLNPDCIITPDTLERMVEEMKRHPEAGMAGCLIVNPDGSEQLGCRRYIPTPWRAAVRVLRLDRWTGNHSKFPTFTMAGLPLPAAPVTVEAISGAFMLVRRAAFDAVGMMDEGYFLHCEDLDWCLRFRRAGWEVLFVPQVTIVHWKGLSSKANPLAVEYHKHRGMVRFYNKFFRQQYPLAVMMVVIPAIGVRFLLKAIWISVRRVVAASMATRSAHHPDLSR